MSMDYGSSAGYGTTSSDYRTGPARSSRETIQARSRTSTLLPLLATGLSAWWLISTLRGTPPVPPRVRRAASSLGRRATSIASPVGQKTGRVASRLKERAGSMASNVKGRAGTVAQGLQQKTSHLKGSVASRTGQAQGEIGRFIQEEPLLACGAAALLGAAVGALIPESPPEHRMMGPARDSLLQKGRDVMGQAAEQVRSHTTPGGPTDALLQAMGLVQGARRRHEETGSSEMGFGGGTSDLAGPDLATQAGGVPGTAGYASQGQFGEAGMGGFEPTPDEIMTHGHVDVGAPTEFPIDEPHPSMGLYEDPHPSSAYDEPVATGEFHDEAMPSPAEEGSALFRDGEPREDLMRREIGEDPDF